ncbi:unnamed protein product [Cylindrotheca closterium]|uniref:TraB domain-containing protein n=1 Tax=Cylindrotheca closterium TaxID=2856 RepID=A0AAD2FQX1_9STRA|nr:unnamed protein product [Cylindrotheca closterium]
MKSKYLQLVNIVLVLHLSHGWNSRVPTRVERSPHIALSARDDNNHLEPINTSRRKWLGGALSFVGGSMLCPILCPVLPSNAAEAVKTGSVCDASVSVFQKGGRVVYLLGTAHVSSSSAELAGKLVVDTQPKGVFVELDPKRVKGSGILARRVSIDETTGQEVEVPSSKVIVPNIQMLTSTSQPSAAGEDAPSRPVSVAPISKPSPMMQAAGAAVGNSIKGMYKKLDSAGFNAGEEFVIAIREGQKIGADIVLGDRDVEVTLQRVAEALSKTDINTLLKPDSELEQSLKELVPNNVAANKDGDLSDAQYRQDFSDFVETVKQKDKVRQIMGQLKRVAPEIHTALLTERDAYMAAGLNGLDEIESIVAVVGIAHVDGIEQSLAMNGWKPASLRCPAI